MPPGRYTLTAWAADLVGGASRRRSWPPTWNARSTSAWCRRRRSGGQLHAPGNCRRPRHGAADRQRTPGPRRDACQRQRLLRSTGLIPGRRYDVTFNGTGIRTLKLVGVTAPTETLDVDAGSARRRATSRSAFRSVSAVRSTRRRCSAASRRDRGRATGSSAEACSTVAFRAAGADRRRPDHGRRRGEGLALQAQRHHPRTRAIPNRSASIRPVERILWRGRPACG